MIKNIKRILAGIGIFAVIVFIANLPYIGYYSYERELKQDLYKPAVVPGCCIKKRIAILNPIFWLPTIILNNPGLGYKSKNSIEDDEIILKSISIAMRGNMPINDYFDFGVIVDRIIGLRTYKSVFIQGSLSILVLSVYWVLLSCIGWLFLNSYHIKKAVITQS
jgi:hypothetical protein